MSMPSIIHGKGLQMKQQNKRQAVNPYLPLYEYIPDGEPHVFGDRLYLYGSHDRFDGRNSAKTIMSAGLPLSPTWRTGGTRGLSTTAPRTPACPTGNTNCGPPTWYRARMGATTSWYTE